MGSVRGYANGGLVQQINGMRFSDGGFTTRAMLSVLAAAAAGRSGLSGHVISVNGPITTTDTTGHCRAIETRFSDTLAMAGL